MGVQQRFLEDTLQSTPALHACSTKLRSRLSLRPPPTLPPEPQLPHLRPSRLCRPCMRTTLHSQRSECRAWGSTGWNLRPPASAPPDRHRRCMRKDGGMVYPMT